MKCQQCDKPATFHITELTGGKPQELHLCEEHARQYLTQSGQRAGRRRQHGGRPGPADGPANGRRPDRRGVGPAGSAGLPGLRHHVLRVPQPGPAWAARTTTSASRRQLEPLILNVHGESEHVGKRPRRSAGRQREAHAADPPPPRDEGSHRPRGLRAGLRLRDEIRRIEIEQRPEGK